MHDNKADKSGRRLEGLKNAEGPYVRTDKRTNV